MIKIHISDYNLPDKQSLISRQRKHRVWLQSGSTFLFSNIKAVKKFLTDTNRFLNQKLFQINDIYLEVFSIYRSTWFYMDNRLDSQIEWLLKDINKMLKNSYQKNDDNSHPFYFLYKAMDLQIEIILIVIDIHRLRYNWAEIHQLESLISRINYLKDELSNFGKDHKAFFGESMESQGLGLNFKMKK